MPKITPRSENNTIHVKTMSQSQLNQVGDWWNAGSKKELSDKLLGTVSYLKQENQRRFQRAGMYASMYSNVPIYGPAGANLIRGNTNRQLPLDRPTMSVITSCVDTVVSKLTMSRPRPIFLTDNGDYKQRSLAKQLNHFIQGELFHADAYQMGEMVLRDASILGTGAVKVLEDLDKRVAIERRLSTELLVDPNDSFYGKPRQLYEMKLLDRSVALEMYPKHPSLIENAEQAYPDTSSESTRTVADMILVAEGWRLPSGPDASDGMHAIATTEGAIFDEKWKKKGFPFAFLHYSPPQLGFWGQGLPERQFGTQMEINKLLITISQSINLVGVPRVFVEDGSKVVKAHLNSSIGSIVTYRGTKPEYSVAPCVPQELYAQLQRLINYCYQQEGVSELSASSTKPAGLTSGEALREYNDTQSDRFAALSRRYDTFFVDLAYLIIDQAKTIAERDGKYQTIYPAKDGTKEIDLPACDLLNDPFVIQCYDASSLPKDPAGRLQKVTEMMQAGIVTPQEGRRLLDYPDIEQVDKLANAPEERILQVLDEIVESGKYTPPDPFMDLNLAQTLVTQYYNLYTQKKLEESKAQKLRDFSTQVQSLLLAAQPAPPPQAGGMQPVAVPQQKPVSDVLPFNPPAQSA